MFDSPILRSVSRKVSATDVTSTADNGDTRKVELSAHHDKDSKEFRVLLSRFTEEKTDSPFVIRKYAPMEDILVLDRVKVARYSDKALHAAFDSSLAKARDTVANGWN